MVARYGVCGIWVFGEVERGSEGGCVWVECGIVAPLLVIIIQGVGRGRGRERERTCAVLCEGMGNT